MSDTEHYTASTTRAWLPSQGRFVQFQDRKAMKAGHPARALQLTGAYPAVPGAVDWSKGGLIQFPLDANTQYLDCMYAAACHADNTFTGNNGKESVFDVNVIVQDYMKLSGGDNGLNAGQIIGAWKDGLANIPAARIFDALSLDPKNVAQMQAAIYFFGGVFFMLDVPDPWRKNFIQGMVWDVPAQADKNNGHAVWWNGFEPTGRYQVQTWGAYCWITYAGVGVCDPSCFAVFSSRWFNSQGMAPNGMGYNQLAGLWVQFGGHALPYQQSVCDAASTFVNENDGAWLLADYDRDGVPDLVLIKTANTAGNRVEVHIASGASHYQTRIFESTTVFTNENDGVWTMADYDRDGRPDLVLIKTSNTSTGHVEVHAASAASNYQTRICDTISSFACESDGVWTMADFDKDGRPDLVFIKTANTPSGHVEVHIVSGASNFQTRICDAVSAFPCENDGTWVMADYDGDGIADLCLIKTSNTTIGHVELHVASGASSYQSFICQEITKFSNETDGVWTLSNYAHKGVIDLSLIKTANTPNGHVEVHIATR